MNRFCLFGVLAAMSMAFLFSCEKAEKIDNREETGQMVDGDRFYLLSVERADIGRDGGVVRIESDEDLIMRWVHLHIGGSEDYTLLYGDEPLYYDEDYVPVFAYPETYPAVYELQDCKITFLAARVVEVDIAASDEQRMFEVVFSGETRTGVLLSPTPVKIYQNKQ